MSKGARHRGARKREQERRDSFVRLYYGTAGVTGAYVKARGMYDDQAGLVLCETPELARPQAVAATALLLQRGQGDRQGLIVEVELPPDRLESDPDIPGHWWVNTVRPGEITGLDFFEATELDDEEMAEDLADRFDTDSITDSDVYNGEVLT